MWDPLTSRGQYIACVEALCASALVLCLTLSDRSPDGRAGQLQLPALGPLSHAWYLYRYLACTCWEAVLSHRSAERRPPGFGRPPLTTLGRSDQAAWPIPSQHR